MHLSFPPFTSALQCSYDTAATPFPVCSLLSDPAQVIFSDDNDVFPARYQYTTPVQLYKKGTRLAASFSTSFVINIDGDSERSVQRVFGGGLAFAITPSPKVDPASGEESLGLFPINEATGGPAAGSPSPRIVAVEVDLSRAFDWDRPSVPHVGLDINSLRSVAGSLLWNTTDFVNRKVAVFVDYDAREESLEVRFQNVTETGTPHKSKAKLFLAYHGLKLSDHVNERSYVGFSARVPTVDSGVYRLFQWTFTTKWVRTKKVQ